MAKALLGHIHELIPPSSSSGRFLQRPPQQGSYIHLIDVLHQPHILLCHSCLQVECHTTSPMSGFGTAAGFLDLAALILSSLLTSLHVPAAQKQAPQHDATTNMPHLSHIISNQLALIHVFRICWFEICPKNSAFDSSAQKILFSACPVTEFDWMSFMKGLFE